MDQELSARLDLTGPGQTGQCAPALQGTGEILWCLAQEENVSMTVNVVLTKLVLTTTAGLLVRMLVDRILSVKQGTMAPSAPVHQDSLETLSLRADSPEDPRLML